MLCLLPPRQRNVYVRYFAQALQEIDDNYIEPVDDQKLFEGAITGMVGELDRYSGFIRQQQAGEFQRLVLDQKFGGIGIEVTYDKETREFKVLTPIFGTPAYEAGIRAGDRIVAVDGQNTRELETKKQVDQAIEMLRGEPGEPVALEVIHEGQTQPVRYELVRRVIHVDSVLGDTRNADDSWNFFLPGYDRIGYVRITSFGERTVDELKAALAVLSEHGVRGLIIDLRSDPGGLLKAAIGVCELFLDRGDPIVSTRGRDPNVKKEEFKAERPGPYPHLPLVVLVNRDSASASEIVAAALQDSGRALVAGERSFGKGTVQNVIPIEAGKSVLKLTIATYWRTQWPEHPPLGKQQEVRRMGRQTEPAVRSQTVERRLCQMGGAAPAARRDPAEAAAGGRVGSSRRDAGRRRAACFDGSGRSGERFHRRRLGRRRISRQGGFGQRRSAAKKGRRVPGARNPGPGPAKGRRGAAIVTAGSPGIPAHNGPSVWTATRTQMGERAEPQMNADERRYEDWM